MSSVFNKGIKKHQKLVLNSGCINLKMKFRNLEIYCVCYKNLSSQVTDSNDVGALTLKQKHPVDKKIK